MQSNFALDGLTILYQSYPIPSIPRCFSVIRQRSKRYPQQSTRRTTFFLQFDGIKNPNPEGNRFRTRIRLFGVPGGNRTHGLSLRRRTLYPTELRKHIQRRFGAVICAEGLKILPFRPAFRAQPSTGMPTRHRIYHRCSLANCQEFGRVPRLNRIPQLPKIRAASSVVRRRSVPCCGK